VRTPKPSVIVDRNASLPKGIAASVIDRLVGREDSWINVLTGIGGVSDKVRAMQVKDCVERLSPTQLTAMFRTEHISRKLVDIYPREALREGVKLGGAGKKDKQALSEAERFLRPWNIPSTVCIADIWGRLYGGCGLFMAPFGKLDDGSERLAAPHKEGDAIAYLRPLDARYLTPTMTDPSSLDEQNRPLWYDIQTQDGKPMIRKVHRSRFVWFGGALTDQETRNANSYWDDSVLQVALNELKSDATAWGSALQLMTEASVGVLMLKGLWSMVGGKSKERLQERVRLTAMARSISRSMVLDADGEDYKRESTSFAGISELTEQAMKRLAATGEIPVTVLFGEAPAGLNATGDSDLRWFIARINAYRQQKLNAPILQLVRAILSMPAAPQTDLDSLELQWPNLWRPNATEQADIYQKTASADQIYDEMGVLDVAEIALSRFTDEGYQQETEIDRELREEMLNDGADLEPEQGGEEDGDLGPEDDGSDETVGGDGSGGPDADGELSGVPDDTETAEASDDQPGRESEDADEGETESDGESKPMGSGPAAEKDRAAERSAEERERDRKAGIESGGAGATAGAGVGAPGGGAPGGKPGANASGARGRLAAAGAAKNSTSAKPLTSAPGGESIQQQALNGTQISSAIEVVKAAVNKEIPRVSAQKLLQMAFQLNAVDAATLLGPEDFEPVKPEPEFGFGGGGFGGPPKFGGKGAPPGAGAGPGKGAPPFGKGAGGAPDGEQTPGNAPPAPGALPAGPPGKKPEDEA
jgi:uncharacterized protein